MTQKRLERVVRRGQARHWPEHALVCTNTRTDSHTDDVYLIVSARHEQTLNISCVRTTASHRLKILSTENAILSHSKPLHHRYRRRV